MFKPDPMLYDETNLAREYTNSGFDRGHMQSFEDAICNPIWRKECFYYGNISMQYHATNGGSWYRNEELFRQDATEFDSIRIWAGNIGEIEKIGMVSAPEKCWKVGYIIKQRKFIAYLFWNSQDDSVNNHPETTIEAIEQLTNLTFKP